MIVLHESESETTRSLIRTAAPSCDAAGGADGVPDPGEGIGESSVDYGIAQSRVAENHATGGALCRGALGRLRSGRGDQSRRPGARNEVIVFFARQHFRDSDFDLH